MMKASELRLGNLVNYKGETVEILGVGLTYLTIQRDINGVAQDFEDIIIQEFEPIPLTEEMLESFGIKFTIEGFYKATDEVLMSSESPYSLYAENSDNSIVWFAGGIKFIHELQNWYKLLTEIELTALLNKERT